MSSSIDTHAVVVRRELETAVCVEGRRICRVKLATPVGVSMHGNTERAEVGELRTANIHLARVTSHD